MKNNLKPFIRVLAFVCLLGVGLFYIMSLFWENELIYQLPTPVPQDYEVRLNGTFIETQKVLEWDQKRPLFLNFYQKKCPCSRFNSKKFNALVRTYGDDIDFRVVLQSSDSIEYWDFLDKYRLDVPVVLDNNGAIADLVGVYSTPQAAILKTNNELYYRGNYNKAKFCTQKETEFARIALESLLDNKPLPIFSERSTIAYGCELPSDI